MTSLCFDRTELFMNLWASYPCTRMVIRNQYRIAKQRPPLCASVYQFLHENTHESSLASFSQIIQHLTGRRIEYMKFFRRSFAILISMVLICGCSPHRPFKSAILAATASGWMERYNIETEEDLVMVASIPKLTKAVEDKNELVRSKALKYLAQFGPEALSAIPQLKLTSVTDRSNRVRLKALFSLTKIAGSENENSLYAYNITLSDKSRSTRKLRQGLVNLLRQEKQLGPKVINMLKVHYKTEPFAYPKKTMLEMVLRYEMSEDIKKPPRL